MGIVNLTDDSFFSGSRYLDSDLEQVIGRMVDEGMDIVDLGACSTRPGSVSVSQEQEVERIVPAVELIRRCFPSLRISVDTFRSEVVRCCRKAGGIDIVNDISAGEDDPAMLEVVAAEGLDYVAMHKRGTPQTMQSLCDYGSLGVVESVAEYFRVFAERAGKAGVKSWMLDPGFGFAKTVEQNYELLDALPRFLEFGVPLFVGVSRKSFIYKPLGLTPETCLEQTQQVHRRALEGGADVLRVHDVAATLRTVEDYRLSI